MDNPTTMNENTLAAIEERVHELNTRAWGLRKHDVQQAYQLAEESLALSRTLIETNSETPVYKQELATALLVLSHCEYRLSGWAPALRLAEEALRYFEEIGDEQYRIYCIESIVRAHGTHGDYPMALEMAYEGLELANKTGDIEARGRVMNMLGILYWHTGDYNRALGWYQQSLDHLRESGNRHEMSEVLNNLGLIYTSLGDENKAFEYCLSGLLTKKELGDKLGESHALLNIGNLYMERKEPDRALAHYLECLYIQEELADKDGRAHTLTNLSHVHMELGDYGQALEYASACLAIARETGNRRVESYALGTFATLHEKQGEHEQAIDAYMQSLAIRRGLGYRQGEITSLLALGELHTRLHSIDKATMYLMEALSIAEELQADNRLCEVHEKLAEMYETHGNTKQALRHYKEFATLQKEVFAEQSSTQLKNLQVLYEMEQATKEAEIYRLENIELAAANREISQQKQELEQQAQDIELFNKELQRQNAMLEKVSREKDEFFNIAVHGLNTPISIIMLAVSMIRNSRTTMSEEEIETNLSYIETTLWRLEDTVRKLLRSNIVESAPLSPHLKPVALQLIAEQVAEEYQSRAELKDMQLVVESESDDITVFADPGMTREIVSHLISNAVKFSPPGTSAYIHIATHTAEPDSDHHNGRTVRLTVRDEGPGINPNDVHRLFGRFERLSAKPTGEEYSLGLGLSIVKKLAESMNGSVWCETASPGATFVVELPAAG